MTVPTKKYNVFIQRFTEQFHKEIDCPDNEGTLQTLITLMNKCGLRELLDPPAVSNSSARLSPHGLVATAASKSHSTPTPTPTPTTTTLVIDAGTNNSAGKKSKPNGFHIFQRERKQRWIDEGKQGNSPDYRGEWAILPESVKDEYKAQARAMWG